MPIAYRDQVSRAQVTGATLAQNTMPAHEKDDLLLWIVGVNTSGGSPSFSTPAGWNPFGAALNGNNAQMVSFFYKTAGSNSEAAPTTTVGGSSPVSACTMVSYSGAATAFDAGNVFNAANMFGATTYNTMTINTLKPNCIVIRVVMFTAYSGAPTVSWASSSERAESACPTPFGSSGALVVADKFQAAQGATGVETVTTTAGGFSTVTGAVFSWPSAPAKPGQFFAMF